VFKEVQLNSIYKQHIPTLLVDNILKGLTQAPTPQQIGNTVRKNCTIIEQVRSMGEECKLPIYLWSEAIFTTYKLPY